MRQACWKVLTEGDVAGGTEKLNTSTQNNEPKKQIRTQTRKHKTVTKQSKFDSNFPEHANIVVTFSSELLFLKLKHCINFVSLNEILRYIF